jgi:citrate lyase subunit beta/citryl-CoA lyase
VAPDRIRFSLIRSKLFVPGSRPELFPKAAASEADALSFDLEDSVPEHGKAQAREAVAGFLRERGSEIRQAVIVRVNGLGSGLFAADVLALEGCRVDVVNVPKVESADDVRRALDAIPAGVAMLANIETPKALRLAAEIATADPRVAGLQVGFLDLFSQCGIDAGETAAKYSIRLAVRLAAAEAGIAVFDSAFADVKNPDGFRAEAEAARRLGFTGKSCIHPSQIAAANEVFAPRLDEIARSERIVSAARERGEGVFLLDGQMIDKPVLDRARIVLHMAETLKSRAARGN